MRVFPQVEAFEKLEIDVAIQKEALDKCETLTNKVAVIFHKLCTATIDVHGVHPTWARVLYIIISSVSLHPKM